MVTGAGGSIGAELCREILRKKPSKLVMVERSEYALYCISTELEAVCASTGVDVELLPELASVNDRRRMADVMKRFGTEIVFHAAAYKHVPIVEQNAGEGVRNNVFGTLNCALAAREAGVTAFVLVSTDKAVRPTNVMGATKRFAEIIVQAFAAEVDKPNFSIVRFGNVLASSGSVVPLFRQQINKGGPVTVTDPEVTRYFMTIPEAASLVIQAAAMSRGGDIFVLDMGEPVRIKELAERMVHLSGLEVRDEDNPDGDIEIVYSGLRPGEKLHEELLISDKVEFTSHPMIMRAREEKLCFEEVSIHLERLRHAGDQHDVQRVRAILSEAVEGYGPGTPQSADSGQRVLERLLRIHGGRRKAATGEARDASDVHLTVRKSSHGRTGDNRDVGLPEEHGAENHAPMARSAILQPSSPSEGINNILSASGQKGR